MHVIICYILVGVASCCGYWQKLMRGRKVLFRAAISSRLVGRAVDTAVVVVQSAVLLSQIFPLFPYFSNMTGPPLFSPSSSLNQPMWVIVTPTG